MADYLLSFRVPADEFTVNSTGEIAKRLYIEQMNHLHSVYWKKFSTFKERMDAVSFRK